MYQRQPEDARPSEEEAVSPQSEPRRSTRVQKPNPKYANAAVAKEDSLKEPNTYEEASQSSKWVDTMKEEINTLEKNQTWELVPKPRDVKPISCKWVYKIKTHPDESIEKYKARLVARGFSQQYALDYDETFSPVTKITTVRVLLAFTVCKE